MYKKWNEIAGIQDTHVRKAFALLDLDTEAGQALAKTIPAYFSQEPDKPGEPSQACPLTLLKELNAPRALAQGFGLGDARYIGSFGLLEELGIPVIQFSPDGMWEKKGLMKPPPELDAYFEASEEHRSFGHAFTWEDKRYVVVDAVWPNTIYIAPEGYIDFAK